jgi:hypothetical protein
MRDTYEMAYERCTPMRDKLMRDKLMRDKLMRDKLMR